jgi:uncharacterized protein (DUF2236 family)
MPEPILPPPDEWAALVPPRGSITWRRAADSRSFLGAGYALLLQVAHPVIGAGVADHSDFQRDPWGRLLRTLDFVNVMVFGGPKAAGEMGRRIRSFHKPINGTLPTGERYNAFEPDAYAWVHATLAEAIIASHARFGRPFRPDQAERFWQEWRRMGRLLGVRDRDLPEDWAGFRAYVDETITMRLQHTQSVDDVLAALGRPAGPPIRGLGGAAWPAVGIPASHVIRLATAGLMAPELRERLDLTWTARQQLELRAIGRTLRSATPLLPARLRNVGPSYLRWRRIPIARGDVANPARLTRRAA